MKNYYDTSKNKNMSDINKALRHIKDKFTYPVLKHAMFNQ